MFFKGPKTTARRARFQARNPRRGWRLVWDGLGMKIYGDSLNFTHFTGKNLIGSLRENDVEWD